MTAFCVFPIILIIKQWEEYLIEPLIRFLTGVMDVTEIFRVENIKTKTKPMVSKFISQYDFPYYFPEMLVNEGYLLHTIPVLKKTWKVSFDMKLTQISTDWRNVIYMTVDYTCDIGPGCRTPSIQIQKNNAKIEVTYGSIPGNGNVYSLLSIPLNSYKNVLVSNTLNSGTYEYKTFIDGLLVHSRSHNFAVEHNNVQVYASRPQFSPAPVYIKNFWIVNGVV